MNRIDDCHNAFTYKKLYDTVHDENVNVVSFDEFKKYRFIYVVEENDNGWCGNIIVIYFYNDKYYLYQQDHCSCNWYEWDPEEVDVAFLKHQFPDVDLDGSVINE